VVEVGSVLARAQRGEGAREGQERPLALLGHEVAPAPAVQGLQRQGLVAAGLEVAQDAAQEVGVAVVPVGDERVGVEQEAHHAAAAARVAASS
jgi:hypothetical protein